ncbi:MAG: hypothetical protein LBV02_03125 [Bacteroidales bacterium]|jgi:hypothetical protein|nr:hypothetical protein [Bacteroidales bacterium]
MNILDYIKGKRRGVKANRLEREAMCDPFLDDALEGYSRFEDDLTGDIKFLQSQVLKRSSQKKLRVLLPYRKRIAIAASYAVFVIGSFLTLFWLTKEDNSSLLTMSETEQPLISSKVEKALSETVFENDVIPENSVEIRDDGGVSKKIPQSAEISDEAMPEDMASYLAEYNIAEEIPITSNEAVKEPDLLILHKAHGVDPEKTIDSTMAQSLIQTFAGRDLTKALASADGVSSVDGDIKSVRGNRSDGQVVIIDGVRVRDKEQLTPNNIIPSQGVDILTESQIVFQFNRQVCPELGGRITVQFTIDTLGNIGPMQIVGTSCTAFEQELHRILKSAGNWNKGVGTVVLNLNF